MRKLVGALAVVITLLWTLPSAAMAADMHHKYGLELQLGGGFHILSDVNDYLPATNFAGITPAEELTIGLQFGVGVLYRQMPDFGWQFGYSRFASLVDQKFRITNEPAVPESWAEQTLSGSEFFAMPTWYWPWNNKEISFGVGPAIYSATLDRSVDIAQEGGSHITSGCFSNAAGSSLGLLGTLGLEMPLKDMLGLSFQLGGRIAKVAKVSYEDPNNTSSDLPVYLNAASGSFLPVDFSGAFLKIALRGYFLPANDWRSPQR